MTQQKKFLVSLQDMDFSPLSRPLTRKDISIYLKAQHKKDFPWRGMIKFSLATGVLGGGFISVMTIVNIEAAYGQAPFMPDSHFLRSVVIIGCATVVIYISALLVMAWMRFIDWRHAFLYRFISRNNGKLIANTAPGGREGLIFEVGHSGVIREGYKFPGGFEIGNYVYNEGHGKGEQTFRWAYAKISLGKEVPNLLLDSKKNNLLGVLSDLPLRIHSSQKYELEGDFNTYFKVYAPEGEASDLLYILTPDVMASLIDFARDYDVEFIGSELYLYRMGRFNLRSRSQIEKVLRALNAILPQITKQTSRYSGVKVVSSSSPTAKRQKSNSFISRLRRGRSSVNTMSLAICGALMFGPIPLFYVFNAFGWDQLAAVTIVLMLAGYVGAMVIFAGGGLLRWLRAWFKF